MKMKKNMYNLLFLLAVVLLSACQDDLNQAGRTVDEGLPARLKLAIKVPSADQVVSSRGIYDYESEVKELALIMFERSGRKVFLNLSDNLTHKAYTNGDEEVSALTQTGGRIYTLAHDIERDDLSGEYMIYAIANWSSPFCGLSETELQNMSEEDLNNAIAANESYATMLSGDQRLPMTYKSSDYVAVKNLPEDATEEDGTTLDISLRRITSHIIFKFRNSETSEKKPNFVPTSYTIYNLPRNAYLVCKGKNGIGYNKLEDDENSSETILVYNQTESLPIPGDELEFFMLENVQDNKDISAYEDRDKWREQNGTKVFSNAPSNATYIVVKGEYSDTENFGEVSYTIHLGNFSGTNYANSVSGTGNFTVNRNEKHTYTVTIKGVDSIITEATNEQEDGGDKPGAEGEITTISEGTNFVLDAHYETIMLSFPFDEKCNRANIIVKTPFDNGEYKLTDGNTFASTDYQWIHFMAPPSIDRFPIYTSGAAVDIDVFALKLSEAYNEYAERIVTDNQETVISDLNKKGYPFTLEKKTDNENNTRIYVYSAAFVDEYFYEGKSWPEFVDQDNRIIILNPAANVSEDKYSIYHADYIFHVAQRSIKTTYAHNGSVNAFGIETWNETGKSQFGYPVYESSDPMNGYLNTATLLGGTWFSDEMKTVTGYFVSPSTNNKDNHIYANANEFPGYQACLTRNRDENGNGVIDEGELKWYLPALEQYTTIWMGRDRLLEDTRLFTEEDMDNLSNDENSEYYWNKVNLWSSSPDKYRVYWPAEGASFGDEKDGQPNLGVRCVRNLLSTTAPMDLITDGESRRNENVILVTGASPNSMRTTSMTGEYTGGHTERQADNRLYAAFEVAQDVIGNNSSSSAQNLTYYYQEDNIARGANWATLRAVSSNNEYTFAVEVDPYGGVVFYETDGKTLGNQLSAQENATNGTITCSANNVSVTISTTLSKCYYSGGYIITLYVVKESGYTYYFQGNEKEMTDTYTEEIKEGVRWFSLQEIKEGNPCATLYSQNEDGSDLGQWRIPNQRELMLMVQYEYLKPNNNGYSTYPYASRTFFTAGEKLDKTLPYTYIGFITLDPGTSNFVIRCVRDASTTSGSGQSQVSNLSGQSGNSYGSGNNLFE